MASRKTHHSTLKSIFSNSNDINDHNPIASDIEFDEADIWGTSTNHNVAPSMENKRTLPISRQPKKAPRKIDNTGGWTVPRASASTSLPLNIPDWSKILKDEYEDHRNKDSDEDFDADDDESHGNYRLPPHEYLARTRGASLSVHEGIGRTLKGRDLRRVRNAIWKKVGFED
ncbi:uncharacterized protein LOC122278772 [Carya illinoinensis]|uniref:Senescence regulator n=1 Tax=Carya illinoinensis TaxID=32201 RepID=A0A8T1P5L3_CARIL|nr:uncharacterized protein LOC122278772 [Carya illinoinensis]KAG6639896.1 hypothetical protein CIPAW_10G133700 [Carya illinoinensis]